MVPVKATTDIGPDWAAGVVRHVPQDRATLIVNSGWGELAETGDDEDQNQGVSSDEQELS